MANTLRVARTLELPPSIVTDRIAFLAKTEGGKTYSCGVLVEELVRIGAQVVVLDNVGKWWALRLSANGKSKGIDIIVLGGQHGDLPLKPHAGAIIADLVVDQSLSVVIDISDWIDSEQRRFVCDFAIRLFQRKKRAPSPLHLVLEECQDFVPQSGFPKGTPDEQRTASAMAHALHRIVKVGRNHGIGVSLLSQRAAAVSKDALTQISTLCALQTTSPNDRKVIGEWFSHVGAEKAKKVVAQLPKLKVGEMYLCSPGRDLFKKVKFRKKKTWDSSATPKLGMKRVEPKQLTKLELAALRDAMEEVVEEAKANDPVELRKEISRLQAELQRAQSAPADMPAKTIVEERIVEVPAVDTRLEQEFTDAIDHLSDIAMKLNLSLEKAKLESARTRETAALPQEQRPYLGDIPVVEDHFAPAQGRFVAVPQPPIPLPKKSNGVTDDLRELGKGPTEVLKALATRHPEPLSRAQIRILCGFSARTLQTYISRLKPTGFVTIGGGKVWITAEGYTALGSDRPSAVRSSAELIAMWKAKLEQGPSRLLDRLIHAHGKPVERKVLEEDLGYSKRTLQTYISRLKPTGLIGIGRGTVFASEVLFS